MMRLVMILGVAVLFGCGGKKDEAAQAKKPAAKAEKPAPKPAPNVVTDDGKVATVKLTGNDQMRFNTTEIRVKEGRKVKVELKNIGTMPVDVMGHNFVLLKPGVGLALFNAKAAKAKDNGHIPPDEAANVIAHTTIVGGGESTSVEFAAPAKGTYDFICSFPGHYALMKGKFIVE
jgi:azurin